MIDGTFGDFKLEISAMARALTNDGLTLTRFGVVLDHRTVRWKDIAQAVAVAEQ